MKACEKPSAPYAADAQLGHLFSPCITRAILLRSGPLDRALRSQQRLHLRTDRAQDFQQLMPWSALLDLLRAGRMWDGRVGLIRFGSTLPIDMVLSLDKKGPATPVRHGALRGFVPPGR